MLKATYRTGSSLILPNSNDNDVVFFYETKEERREALIKHKHSDEIDAHFDYIRPLKVFLGCYIYHFMELVEGEDLHLNDFSIFEHQEEYMELLKWYAERLSKKNKRWYHILTAYYMFKNNSYDLTEPQLKAIQSAHDKGITDAKYNLCIEWLGVVS